METFHWVITNTLGNECFSGWIWSPNISVKKASCAWFYEEALCTLETTEITKKVATSQIPFGTAKCGPGIDHESHGKGAFQCNIDIVCLHPFTSRNPKNSPSRGTRPREKRTWETEKCQVLEQMPRSMEEKDGCGWEQFLWEKWMGWSEKEKLPKRKPWPFTTKYRLFQHNHS